MSLDSLCEAVVLHVELKVSSSSFVNISAFKNTTIQMVKKIGFSKDIVYFSTPK